MQQHQTLSVLPCFWPAWLRLLSMFSPEFWFLPAYQAGCDEFGVPADHSGHRSGPGLAFRAFLSFQVGKSKDTMANDTAGCERPAGSGTQILHSEYSEQIGNDPYDPWYPWRFEQILQVGTPSKTVTVHFLRCVWQITSFTTALESLYMQGSDLSGKGSEDLKLGKQRI